MGFYLSPGVYTKEKDISQIIPNLSTTIGGIVGYSTKGDIDNVKLITNSQQFIEEYGKPVPGNYFHYSALAFLENGTRLYSKRVVNGALYGGVKIRSSVANVAFSAGLSSKAFQTISGETTNLFFIFAKDPGTWNANIAVRITNLDTDAYTFDIEVYLADVDGVYSKVETWTVSRKTKTDGYGKQLYLETRVNYFSKYIWIEDSTVADTTMPVAQASNLVFVGGSDGSAVTDGNLTTGWDVFTNPDDIDVRILINAGQTSVTVQSKLKTIAEARKDCIAILDIPSTEISSVSAMTTWRTSTQNFNSSYCALYGGWLKKKDEFNDKIVDLPPSGFVASQYAYNDYLEDPWTVPAGTKRGIINALGVSNVFSQGDRDSLYFYQINPIQMYRGEGIVIWGNKTEQKTASALSSVNVRRLLISIEKAMAISLKSFAFEINNRQTRFKITTLIESYLTILASRGAFNDDTGKGFLVQCDANNNPPSVIDEGQLNVDVFVKPARAAEYIQLQTIITTTGANFNELIAKTVLF